MASAVPRRFEPKGVVGWLVLIGVCYVCAFGFATTMVYRDLGASESEVFPARAQQALLVLLYLLAGYAILLYGVFGAHRFRFSDAGPAGWSACRSLRSGKARACWTSSDRACPCRSPRPRCSSP